MRHRLWILPIIMLALAAIACSPAYIYDVISVQSVVTDPEVFGRAFATVIHETNGQQSHPIMVVAEYHYVTYDFGENWWRWEGEIPSIYANALPLTLTSETLWLNGQALWHFPRPEFRQFFYHQRANYIYFQLPEAPSNQIQGNVLYVAMGTEGVLVGPAPGTNSNEEWRLINTDIDVLRPLTLSITELREIVLITLLLLFVPLLPLFHGYLLSRVWVYIMPLRDARRLAAIVSIGFTAICAVVVVLWITQSAIDYVSVSVFTILTLSIITVIITYRASKDLEINASPKKYILLASALIPCIIASIGFAFWSQAWIVAAMVIGYTSLRPEAYYFLHKQELVEKPLKNDELWSIDRLSIEAVSIGAIIALMMDALLSLRTGISITGSDPTFVNQLGEHLLWGIILVVVALTIRVINWRFKLHARQLASSKPKHEVKALYFGITASLFVWGIIASIIGLSIFIGQSIVRDWFWV